MLGTIGRLINKDRWTDRHLIIATALAWHKKKDSIDLHTYLYIFGTLDERKKQCYQLPMYIHLAMDRHRDEIKRKMINCKEEVVSLCTKHSPTCGSQTKNLK